MSLPLIIAAALAGAVGSAHCVAMCGGISGALAMADGANGTRRRLARALLHNAGRVTSYALAGALAGGIGVGIGDVLDIAAWSLWLRAASGAVLVLIGLQLLTGRALLHPVEALGLRFWRRLAPLARRLLPARHPGTGFAVGMLWGWLPCGLVYSMLLTATTAGGAPAGALVMAAFGLGTLPALLGTAGAAAGVQGALKRGGWRRPAGVVVVVMGVWTAAGTGLVPLLGGHGGMAH